eukprot:TRINITY_DN10120_c0_g1_i3.p1 TRINITY_DN10120_c0_g1~~TRINITY_DN10120_c0_g1_i3.p1  ORF type:complete len:883 (+),score=195.77 TRINITY_DN10120_c0_g1_i3:111-2759(+)
MATITRLPPLNTSSALEVVHFARDRTVSIPSIDATSSTEARLAQSERSCQALLEETVRLQNELSALHGQRQMDVSNQAEFQKGVLHAMSELRSMVHNNLGQNFQPHAGRDDQTYGLMKQVHELQQQLAATQQDSALHWNEVLVKQQQQASTQMELRSMLRKHEEAMLTSKFNQQASEAELQSRTNYSLEAVYNMLHTYEKQLKEQDVRLSGLCDDHEKLRSDHDELETAVKQKFAHVDHDAAELRASVADQASKMTAMVEQHSRVERSLRTANDTTTHNISDLERKISDSLDTLRTSSDRSLEHVTSEQSQLRSELQRLEADVVSTIQSAADQATKQSSAIQERLSEAISRASQLHNEAIMRLRAGLKGAMDLQKQHADDKLRELSAALNTARSRAAHQFDELGRMLNLQGVTITELNSNLSTVLQAEIKTREQEHLATAGQLTRLSTTTAAALQSIRNETQEVQASVQQQFAKDITAALAPITIQLQTHACWFNDVNAQLLANKSAGLSASTAAQATSQYLFNACSSKCHQIAMSFGCTFIKNRCAWAADSLLNRIAQARSTLQAELAGLGAELTTIKRALQSKSDLQATHKQYQELQSRLEQAQSQLSASSAQMITASVENASTSFANKLHSQHTTLQTELDALASQVQLVKSQLDRVKAEQNIALAPAASSSSADYANEPAAKDVSGNANNDAAAASQQAISTDEDQQDQHDQAQDAPEDDIRSDGLLPPASSFPIQSTTDGQRQLETAASIEPPGSAFSNSEPNPEVEQTARRTLEHDDIKQSAGAPDMSNDGTAGSERARIIPEEKLEATLSTSSTTNATPDDKTPPSRPPSSLPSTQRSRRRSLRSPATGPSTKSSRSSSKGADVQQTIEATDSMA